MAYINGKKDFSIQLASGGGAPELIDLTALGLPDIPFGGEYVSVSTDTTGIVAALQKNSARFCAYLKYIGMRFYGEMTTTSVNTSTDTANYICCCNVLVGEAIFLVSVLVDEDSISAKAVRVQPYDEFVTEIDMTAFDTEGKITETYIDGTSKTTTIAFDEDGNPSEITDGNGMVTTITW